jgi:hypothetical protein
MQDHIKQATQRDRDTREKRSQIRKVKLLHAIFGGNGKTNTREESNNPHGTADSSQAIGNRWLNRW